MTLEALLGTEMIFERSLCCEKRSLLNGHQDSFHHFFSLKRNKDYLKVGYIVLYQKKRRKFNLQTGG